MVTQPNSGDIFKAELNWMVATNLHIYEYCVLGVGLVLSDRSCDWGIFPTLLGHSQMRYFTYIRYISPCTSAHHLMSSSDGQEIHSLQC